MTQTLRIAHDGIGLHIEVDGAPDAPPVVFLHGVTGSGETWRSLPPRITDGRRIIRIDMRGHGRSEPAPGAYTVPDYAGDVVAVLTELCAPGRAVLVGHSLGGVVAWAVTQAHPELVAAAFLEDPPLYAPDMDAPENAALRAVFQATRDGVLAARAAGASVQDIAAALGAVPAGPGPDAPTMAELLCDDAIQSRASAQHSMDVAVVEGAIDGSTLTGVDLESPVSPPVFVLAADERVGGVFRVAHRDRLALTHPDIEVVALDGCGHLIHDERRYREIFTEQLERFLHRHA